MSELNYLGRDGGGVGDGVDGVGDDGGVLVCQAVKVLLRERGAAEHDHVAAATARGAATAAAATPAAAAGPRRRGEEATAGAEGGARAGRRVEGHAAPVVSCK